MSVLTNQTSINQNKYFWLRANVSSLTLRDLTAETIKANILAVSSLSASSFTTSSILSEVGFIEDIFFSTSFGNLVSTLEVDGGLGRFVSVITGEISLDQATLNVINGDTLLLNGIPIATTDALSSIQDWSIFPAYSTIYIANSNVNLGDSQFGVNTAFLNKINNSSISTSWIESGQGYISQFATDLFAGCNLFVSSLETENGLFSSLTTSSLQTAVLNNWPVGSLSNGNLRLNNLQAISASISSLSVSTLQNLPLSNYAASNWSRFAALQTVNMSNQSLSAVNNINTSNLYASNQLYGNDTRGQQGTFSNQINVGWFSNIFSSGYNFNVNSGGNVSCYDIDAEDITACNINVGNTGTGQADVNIYGGFLVPGDNALFVEGGVEFDGGLIHGTAFGCLPVAGINTTRFSMTPAAGIVMITPIAISMNAGAVMNQAVGGAYSLAVGGVANLAAGTYMEVDTGLLKLINNTPIILSANSGAGNPGGLNLNTYTAKNSLALDGFPFGALDKYQSSNSWTVSSTSAQVFLETLSLPRIGQWYIKTSFEIVKDGGGQANSTDGALYYAPNPNPTVSAFNQCIFGAPLYSMPSSQILTINAPVIISSFTGFTSTIFSTITENFSTFLSTGQTFSTFTSSFYSTTTAAGGLNLYFDGAQSQNNFTATITRGSLYASYLGGYIPAA